MNYETPLRVEGSMPMAPEEGDVEARARRGRLLKVAAIVAVLLIAVVAWVAFHKDRKSVV